MKGILKNLTYSQTGENILTITTKESCKTLWDKYGGGEVNFTVKKYTNPRSLKANNYAWTLIEKLADAVKLDKEELYEEMLRRYGTGESYEDDDGNECKVLFSLREDIPPRLGGAALRRNR